MKALLFAAALSVSVMSGAASAATITFDDLAGSNGDAFSSFSEDGFSFTKTSGDAFVAKLFGNPIPDVFFGPNYGSAAASFDLTSGVGDFVFGGFDLAGNNGAANYVIAGFLDGASVFAFAGSHNGGFTTIGSPSSGLVDKVSFLVTAGGTSANIDNIVATVAAVPEPATWAMMLIGFGAVGAAMRSQRRRVRTSVSFA